MPKDFRSFFSHLGATLTSAILKVDEWCRRHRIYDRYIPIAVVLCVFCALVYSQTIAAPDDFQKGTLIKVTNDESVGALARDLESHHLIHSAEVFMFIDRILREDRRVIAGEYYFAQPQTLLHITRRFARGDFELIPVKVTLPEGQSTAQMAEVFKQRIPDFNFERFIAESKTKEGYLFPDSYFFLPGADPDLVIHTMEDNFKLHLNDKDVQEAFAKSDKPLVDVITMASLLEKEANDSDSRRIIAGILWKRIALHMPLQVDAVFPYIIGKNSLQLTKNDLKVDSPYNTYIYLGLPPGPIANPGIDAILDALNPKESKYLFYLSDRQGNFHYSATYAGQLANQNRYLK